jgi:hypothetical protein
MASFQSRHHGDRGRQRIDFGRERFVGKVLKVGSRGIGVQREFVLLVLRCWGSGGVGSVNHDVILRWVATELIEGVLSLREFNVYITTCAAKIAATRLELSRACPKLEHLSTRPHLRDYKTRLRAPGPWTVALNNRRPRRACA